MRKRTKLIALCLPFFLLLSILPTHIRAQTIAKRVTASNGDSVAFLEYKPAGHNAPGNTRKYPLIIFLHGGNERNDNPSLLPGPTDSNPAPVWSLRNYGPIRTIYYGHRMNFTWNGQTDSFMVLSPMSRYKYRTGPYSGNVINVWPPEYVDAIMNYARDSLKVDTNRIYLTGHSYGGGGTFNYLKVSSANAQKLAAAAPVSAWLTSLNSNGYNYVATAKLPLWGFHAVDDPTTDGSYIITENSINGVNALNPQVRALITLWPAGTITPNPHAHAPLRVYDVYQYPYGSEGIINNYEWFLGQNKDSAVNVLPVARVGNDTTILSSSGVANLNASTSTDADGTIVRYVWRKISGPSGGTIATPFGSASSTTVSGLTTPGVYKYQLNVVDHRAAIARDTLTITVDAPPGSGKAVSITSTGGRINAGNVAELINAAAFTVEAQFKYDSSITDWSNAEACIYRKYVTATDRIKLYVDKATRSVQFTLANGSDMKGYTASNVVSHDTWHHVAAVFDGAQTGNANRMKIYINGVQQTLSFTDTIGTSTSGSAGSSLFGGEPSAGRVTVIDEVRLWDTALAAGTINSWKNKLLGICHPNFNRLTVYWPLDNDANPASAAAASGTLYPGVITNGTYVNGTLTLDTIPCPVDSGKAVSITSTGGRINAGNVAELINAAAFTIEARFKYDSSITDWSNAEACIYRKHVTATDRIKLHVDKATRSVQFTLANGSDRKGYTTSNVVSHDTWYHVAAVFDGAQTGNANRMKIYINGVQQTLSFTDTIGSSTSGSSGSSLFGGEPSAARVTVIDEVRIWDTVLAADTINSWKNKLLGSCHPNFNRLTVYWPLDNDANPASAAAALGTIYPGVITNGTYVSSSEATAASACGGARVALFPPMKEVEESKPFTGKIYPNPTEGLVQIELNAPASKSVTVKVLDMYGKYLIRTERRLVKGNNRMSLNIEPLPSGTYIIEVSDGKSILEKYKVMKR